MVHSEIDDTGLWQRFDYQPDAPNENSGDGMMGGMGGAMGGTEGAMGGMMDPGGGGGEDGIPGM